ncbi:hypothetical protein D9757_009166 [Collybiopsis confluens]|uniref:mannan endo-1,4-beta-mannosidase n=1 Tax=Collybiopsis confluens TaxID=2823264 RepID=A0A8H5M1W7_9AGAR|nr:hypothetical protein D9757_009166 [Collybiopsis confluens]
MPRLASLVLLAVLVITSVSAQSQSFWGQCGGIGFTGPTTCVSGATCEVINEWCFCPIGYIRYKLNGILIRFFQCIPDASSVAPTSTVSTVSISSTTTVPSPTATVTGFVKTSGIKFTLNGKPFTVVGANAYWVGLMGYGVPDMMTAFRDIAATGGSVCRTNGFNEVTVPDGVAYYQSWSGSTPTINTGANGLQNFDNVVAAAKANGIRLIVTLESTGGMDVYVNQILGQGQPHDFFYTNPTVIAAFKNYVKTFVTRYLNEPGILAWELANEPRCLGTTNTGSGTCSISTISTWIQEISSFIKSIDPNHLVAVGDEGFFNEPGNPTFVYQGFQPSLGIDFAANLNISTVDFGTFHNYPASDSYDGASQTFGAQWIQDHAAAMKASNKPVIMEEFSVAENTIAQYTNWYSIIESTGMAGDLIWQSGSILSNGPSDPNLAVYPGSDVYTLNTQHAAALRARDGDPQ